MSQAKTRRVLLSFVTLLIIGIGFSCIYRIAWSDIQRTDYTVYTAAGQAILDHSDLYSAQNIRGWKYVYPPAFALLMVPFAQLPLAVGALLWYLLEVASIAAVSLMSMALLKPWLQERHKTLLYSLPLISLCVLLVAGAQRGQASIFMFALMVATFYFHFQKRPVAAGMSLAAASLIKVFPIVLILYFCWRRQWKTLMATGAALVLMSLIVPSLFLGWSQNIHNIDRWVDVVGRPAMMSNTERSVATPLYEQLLDARKPRNQSLEALFLSANVSPATSKHLVAGCALVMLLTMLRAAQFARSRFDELALAGAFLAWSLLIPPISETHYFGALILPLTVLLGRSLYEGERSEADRSALIARGAGTMIVVMGLIRSDYTESFRPLCVATVAIWGLLIYSIFQSTTQRRASLLSSATA